MVFWDNSKGGKKRKKGNTLFNMDFADNLEYASFVIMHEELAMAKPAWIIAVLAMHIFRGSDKKGIWW